MPLKSVSRDTIVKARIDERCADIPMPKRVLHSVQFNAVLRHPGADSSTQIVQSEIVDPCPLQYPLPRLADIDEVLARLGSWKNEGIAAHSRKRIQYGHCGRTKQKELPLARLCILKFYPAEFPINLSPFSMQKLVSTGTGKEI